MVAVVLFHKKAPGLESFMDAFFHTLKELFSETFQNIEIYGNLPIHFVKQHLLELDEDSIFRKTPLGPTNMGFRFKMS